MAKPVDCRCELHLLWLVGLAFLILNSTDKRFVDEDFYNASHLTDIGANKFSKIVKKEDIIDKHHKRQFSSPLSAGFTPLMIYSKWTFDKSTE